MTQTDRRDAFVHSYAIAADIATGVRPDQTGDPTPCAEYDVATLVDHLVFAGRRAAELGRGATTAEQTHVPLADAPGELRRAGSDAEWAWADDARLDAKIEMPWGQTYLGVTLVDMYLAELAAHAWDLAAATGQLDRLEKNCAAPALAGARAMLRPEYREVAGPGSPYGPEVEVPDDAPEWDRFAAFMGRDPSSWKGAPR